jgi:ribosomal protein S20
MPIIKSAIKRMHQAATRRTRNQQTKRSLKAALKAFAADMSADNLRKAQSEIDTAVKKNLMEKNTAARKKSHLAAAAKNAGVKVTAKAAAKKETPKAAAPAKKATAAKKPAATKKAAPAKKPAAKKAAK